MQSPGSLSAPKPTVIELYRLVEDKFHQLERVWEEHYEKQYGFWRPIIRQVVE